jgi:endonuclease YncB( thermonuclease family)
MFRLHLLSFSLLVAASLHAAPQPNWEKLEGCTLGDTKWADGDSFHIKHNGQDLIIRLYFVDTPEDAADQRFPERIAEQAGYFGLTSEEVLKVGDAAAKFTARTLGPASFTVYTCGQDAMGASKQPRTYGFVETQQGSLAELLVKNGLARIYGKRITTPDGMDSRQYLEKLGKLEQESGSDWRRSRTSGI